MKIVYDMRTGEIVERTGTARRTDTEVRQLPTTPLHTTELQLAEYRWSRERNATPPTFLACYFDEDGE